MKDEEKDEVKALIKEFVTSKPPPAKTKKKGTSSTAAGELGT